MSELRILEQVRNFYYVILALCKTMIVLKFSSKQLKNHSFKKLEKIIRKSRDIPYYKSLFNKMELDNKEFSLVEFRKIPILTKSIFRSNYPDRILEKNINVNKCIKQSTSGTTGYPLQLIYPIKTYIFYIVTLIRTYFIIGYRPWHNLVYIKYDVVEQSNNFSLGPLFKTHHINSELSPQDKIKLLRNLDKIDLLASYPSSLLEICYYLTADDKEKIKPKFISVNSESVSAEQLNFIAESFGCPVYNEYSAQECWAIASQCKWQSWHIFTDNVFLEILDEDDKNLGFGEEGRIIVTTLNNPIMPLIRYEIGDRGALSKKNCKCGLKFPVLAYVQGRSLDYFELDGGEKIFSMFFYNTLIRFVKKFPGTIYVFQFIYFGHNEFDLRIKPGLNYQPIMGEEITAELKAKISEPISIQIVLTDEFKKGPTGKMLYFINLAQSTQ